MPSFMDQMRSIEKESKVRTSLAKKEDSPRCVNCSYVGRDNIRTEVCVSCKMSTTRKFKVSK